MNVFWIMTDQLQAGYLGFTGHPQAQTPNLDRLAARGIVFENCFTQSPVCMAARACLFTGRYPASVKMRGMGVLPPQETTTPEWLQRHGYRTFLSGKLHLTPECYTRDVLKSDVPVIDWKRFLEPAAIPGISEDPYKDNFGFLEHVDCDDANRGTWHAWLRDRDIDPNMKPDVIDNAIPDLYVSPYGSEHHHTTFIAAQAEAFIRRKHKAPWFNFCSFIAPHHPFEAPADQIARYPLDQIILPAYRDGAKDSGIPDPAARAIDGFTALSETTRKRIVQHYLASISLIDDNVGRLMTALEESGQTDNTIVIFTADHGEFCGSRGLLRKPSIHYDELIRVPLVISLPGGQIQRRIPGMVEQVDLHPTLMRLLGLDLNPGVQGADWSEQLKNGGPVGKPDIYSEMHDMPDGPYMAVRTLRTEEWKLNIYPTAGMEYGQLFDVKNDPEEMVNRYHDPSCRDIREKLLWQLTARVHRDTDPLPVMLSQY